jgi:flagellar hook-basal body complex protein FliE
MEITNIPSALSNPLWDVMNNPGRTTQAVTDMLTALNPGAINPAGETEGSVFDNMLTAMLGNINETNQAIRHSQEFQLDVALGHSDDLLGLTLAMDNANSALNFTVQVTNRLLEAYREIMRMQI